MKKLITSAILGICFFSGTASALSGACSNHSGVNCPVGPDIDGSVICNDGWAESTVEYAYNEDCFGGDTKPVCLNGKKPVFDLVNFDKLANSFIPQYLIDNRNSYCDQLELQRTQLEQAKKEYNWLAVDAITINSIRTQIACTDSRVQISKMYFSTYDSLSHLYWSCPTIAPNPVLSTPPIALQSSLNFNDIDYNGFREAILYVKSKGIVDGYSDGSYRPNGTINRAEFTKIVINALGYTPTGNGCFKDIKTEWFAPYVCTAKEKKLIDGYKDGSFKPSANINQAEAVKILVQAFNIPKTGSTGTQWYEVFMNSARNEGLFEHFVEKVSDSLLRGEMAQLIFNIKSKN